MAEIDLHKFERDLKSRPGPGSAAPPRTIRAKDLDGNFNKVTLLKDNNEPALYDLEYTKDGVRLTRLLPDGKNKGDLLYWDRRKWVVLRAVQSETLHVLTIQDGTLKWVPTEDC